ncbi:uncharacterized protein CBL_09202 [Carabus blaptoides fortunei]
MTIGWTINIMVSMFRQSSVLVMLISTIGICVGQGFFFPPPRGSVAHRAVLANAAQEAQLPPHLLNPFYKDPRIREALARESWFGPGERPVWERQAEKISRREIYTVLNHAGLIRTH